MKGNLYAMITTKNSRHYTDTALTTFFKSTKLSVNDEFVLIDNDNEGTYSGVEVISNPEPYSFAKNCNNMIDRANGKTFVLLSNDVAFALDWNKSVTQYGNALVLPSCNQTHLYNVDGLVLQPSMHLNEYNNNYTALNKISQLHKQSVTGLFERLLMGFYVFVLPSNVYKKIGYLDEHFGVGGGEDVDYRLRAIQQGIPVKYVAYSYLLHFAGKSTWDGPEHQQEIAERNKKYFSTFATKWGDDLANLCLVGGDVLSIIEKYQLHNYINDQKFSEAIKVVLNNQNRN